MILRYNLYWSGQGFTKDTTPGTAFWLNREDVLSLPENSWISCGTLNVTEHPYVLLIACVHRTFHVQIYLWV